MNDDRHSSKVFVGALLAHGWKGHQNDPKWGVFGNRKPASATDYKRLVATALGRQAKMCEAVPSERQPNDPCWIVYSADVPRLRIILGRSRDRDQTSCYAIISAYPTWGTMKWGERATSSPKPFKGKLIDEFNNVVPCFDEHLSSSVLEDQRRLLLDEKREEKTLNEKTEDKTLNEKTDDKTLDEKTKDKTLDKTLNDSFAPDPTFVCVFPFVVVPIPVFYFPIVSMANFAGCS